MLEKLISRIKDQTGEQAIKNQAVNDVIGNAAFFLDQLAMPSEHREELKRRLWENLRILHDEYYFSVHGEAAILASAIESMRLEAGGTAPQENREDISSNRHEAGYTGIKQRAQIVQASMTSATDFRDRNKVRGLAEKLDEARVPLPRRQGPSEKWEPKTYTEVAQKPNSNEYKRLFDSRNGVLVRDLGVKLRK